MITIEIENLKAGDYVEAEFRELTTRKSKWDITEPTGRTYVLHGEIEERDGFNIPGIMVDLGKSLVMHNGQCVRQADGSPGGNLVRITQHIPKEIEQNG